MRLVHPSTVTQPTIKYSGKSTSRLCWLWLVALPIWLRDAYPVDAHTLFSLARRVSLKAASSVGTLTDYAGRLWKETNPDAHQRIGKAKILETAHQLEKLVRSFHYRDENESHQVHHACSRLLEVLHARNNSWSVPGEESIPMTTASSMQHTTPTTRHMISVSDLHETSHGPATKVRLSDHCSMIKLEPCQKHVPGLLSMPSFTSLSSTLSTSSRAVADTALSLQGEPPRLPKVAKGRRSIMRGVVMGLAATFWVFSGNYIFTGVFTIMTILTQLEYYRTVMSTGVYPARRISIIGACSMYLTALFTPHLHQICLPLFGLSAMVWFLTMKRSMTTIPEIATTFTGMFYLGYVPSFWVRIRLVEGDGEQLTRLAPLLFGRVLDSVQTIAEASFPALLPWAEPWPVSRGAIFIFWTWLCLALSDVGAYFIGRNLGQTKLARVSPAAGATSPNKTVEGVLGGCAASMVLAIFGAWIQQWPYFIWTGAAHGFFLGLVGLLGDLTASVLKRDAGLKDFGDLIPEHGGILDRVDSYVWAAPYSWLVCVYILPALKQFSLGG